MSNLFGTNSRQTFQVWIGVNGVEDMVYASDPGNLPDSLGQPFLVGAENLDGTSSASIPGLPTEDLRVTSDPAPPDPAEDVTDLKDEVSGLGLAKGVSTALNSKLDAALAALDADDTAGAGNALNAFLDPVAAKKGKKSPVCSPSRIRIRPRLEPHIALADALPAPPHTPPPRARAAAASTPRRP